MATIDTSALQTFTPVQLLILVEYAIAHLLAGGESYTINARSFKRADLDKLRKLRDDLKAEVASAASATGSMTVLGAFGRQQ